MIFFLLSFLANGALAGPVAAGQAPRHVARVIVLDPGHGGHDNGAAGENNIFEKKITLSFARILADKLKPTYSVSLTRADDYQVAPANRTALANHLEADLFISLHTGASVLHNPNGILLAYHENSFRIKPTSGIDKSKASRTETILSEWQATSSQNLKNSRSLATILREQLRHDDESLNVDIQGMPLMVLHGADLPALLIEIGYITNPADLEKLQNSAKLNEYAEIIVASINAYFSSQPNPD